jgi:hypothetical protein
VKKSFTFTDFKQHVPELPKPVPLMFEEDKELVEQPVEEPAVVKEEVKVPETPVQPKSPVVETQAIEKPKSPEVENAFRAIDTGIGSQKDTIEKASLAANAAQDRIKDLEAAKIWLEMTPDCMKDVIIDILRHPKTISLLSGKPIAIEEPVMASEEARPAVLPKAIRLESQKKRMGRGKTSTAILLVLNMHRGSSVSPTELLAQLRTGEELSNLPRATMYKNLDRLLQSGQIMRANGEYFIAK